MSASQYVLSCDNGGKTDQLICSIAPYSPPPATVEHYSFAPTWGLWLVAAIVLATVVATGIVRWKAHEERGQTERTRITNPPKQCPTCGDKLEAA